MAVNKNLKILDSPTITKRIIQAEIYTGSHSTIQDHIEKLAITRNKLLKASNEDLIDFNPQSVKAGDIVESKPINRLFDSAIMDIGIVSDSLNEINERSSQQSLRIESKVESVGIELKKLKSELDLAGLYLNLNDPDKYGVTETFNATTDISELDGLIDVNEGHFTAAIVSSKEVSLTDAVVKVENTSTGTFTADKDIYKAFDNENLTYFEYWSGSPLRLDFKIDLLKSTLLNKISFIVNTYGESVFPFMEELSVSPDGVNYTSIKENIFLTPESNKLSTDFSFTFTPKHVRFIKISLSQNTANQDNRYVVSLKEVRAYNFEFKNEGSFIITKKIPSLDIQNLSVSVNDDSFSEEIFEYDIAVSTNKTDYNKISPIESVKDGIKVLSYNQPWIAGNIEREDLSDEVRLNYSFKKKPYNKNSVINYIGNFNISNEELFPFPVQFPVKISLAQFPIKESIKLFSVLGIRRGVHIQNKFRVGFTSPKHYYYKYILPVPITNESVFIGSLKLTKYDSPGELINGTSHGYTIRHNILYVSVFSPLRGQQSSIASQSTPYDPWIVPQSTPAGVATVATTELPDPILDGEEVYIQFESDVFSSLNSNILSLSSACDGIKDNVDVYKFKMYNGEIAYEEVEEIIPANTKVMSLVGVPDFNYGCSIIGGHRVDFIDGVTEFVSSSDYAFSIDPTSRNLYLRNAYNVAVSITYYQRIEFKLNSGDFELSESNKEILLKDWAYDNSYYYRAEYNMCAGFNSDEWEILPDNKTIQFKNDILFSGIISQDQRKNFYIKANYLYNNADSNILIDTYESLSPIVKDIKILYTVEK